MELQSAGLEVRGWSPRIIFPLGNISDRFTAEFQYLPAREDIASFSLRNKVLLPYGNMYRYGPMTKRIDSVDDLADFIRKHRKSIGMTQVDLAGASGLGVRFIGDLERGKPTCEIGKTLRLLTMLGIELEVRTRTGADE
jgi:y4mF family transcriptional regulator